MGEDGVAVTEISCQQGAEQSAAQKRPAAPSRDTMEINAEGRAASDQTQNQQTETEPAAVKVEP